MDSTPNSTYYKRENKKEKDKNQNIQVFVRCRPLNLQEKKIPNVYSIVDVNTDKREIVVRERPNDKVHMKKFTFDKVFPPHSEQIDVYKTVVQPLLDEVLTGYNCTVFAYGQTGTGKTFTMEGAPCIGVRNWEDESKAGIIPRCLHHLFEELGNLNVEYSVRVSYIELYNEEVFDLLSPCDDANKLYLYEDSTRKGSVIIKGLEEVVVQNKDDVYEILDRGSEKRKTASTLMNAHSSRSHSVFSVTIHIKENTVDGEDLLKTGKLNLVDLAGSENIGRSGAVDKRAREAGNINQSLLTLGRVITALVEKAPHVPYRESKLTRLLQESLGGRTKTSIIATISPASCDLDETLSTLDYAHRAKNIMNRPEVNQKMTKKALIKAGFGGCSRKKWFFIDESNFRAMEAQIAQSSKDITEKIANVEHLEAEILRVNKMFEDTKKDLETTSMNLKTTEKHLTTTKSRLQCTESKLVETIQECNEQKYIVSEHLKKEETLSDQAHLIIQTADVAVSDVNGLHEKLERKRDVEAQNDEVSRRFQSRHEHNMGQLSDNIRRFTDDAKSFCTELKASIGKRISKQTADLSLLTELITYMATSETNKLDDILKSAHTNAGINKQFLADLTGLTRQLKKDTLENHKQQEKNCFSNLAIIANILNEQSASITQTNTDFLTKLESHESSVRSSSTSMLDEIDKFSQEFKSYQDKQLQEREQQKRQFAESRRTNDNREKAISMQIEMIKKQVANLEKISKSTFEETNESMNTVKYKNIYI
uniref:Kinesin-like protein n=1 Tax=Strigamia maritima TaxID=126957 RepID=T1IQI6_STRMM